MGVGRAHAVSLLGLDGAPVEIEADTASGLPAFVLVGVVPIIAGLLGRFLT